MFDTFNFDPSEESNFTPSHSTAPNPDIVNEDDFQGLNKDVKIDKYIIPVTSNCKGSLISQFSYTSFVVYR